MKPWHDYSHTIASIAQSFVSVCQHSMSKEEIQSWALDQLTPNDCMDANLVMDSIIENHGIVVWSDGYLNEESIRFFNQCYEASENLNKELVKVWFPHIAIKETA